MLQIWGGGAGEKNRLQYFEFGLQYLVQPLGVNPTYSTFKSVETHRSEDGISEQFLRQSPSDAHMSITSLTRFSFMGEHPL